MQQASKEGCIQGGTTSGARGWVVRTIRGFGEGMNYVLPANPISAYPHLVIGTQISKFIHALFPPIWVMNGKLYPGIK